MYLSEIRAIIDGSTFLLVEDRASEPSVVYNGIEKRMPDIWDDCEVEWMSVLRDCTLHIKINSEPFEED